MKLNEILGKINYNNNYFVIPDKIKSNVIRAKSNYELTNKVLVDFKIITYSELINLLSFDVLDEIYLFNLEENNLPLSVINEKIRFSKYNLDKKNDDLNKFLDFNKKYILENKFFKDNIKKYTFNILGNDVLLKPFIDYYKLKVNYINIDKIKEDVLTLKFNTKEDEVFYLFEEIAKLLHKNIDINKIYISNIDNTYFNLINKFKLFYNINVNYDNQVYLNDIPYIKDIMSKEYELIIQILKDEAYRNELYQKEILKDKIDFETNINKLISLFNKYPTKNYKTSNILKVIKEDLKNLKVKSKVYSNAVNVISNEEILGLDESNYIFILNTVYESFPKLSKDNDYLSDNDKELINYPTSSDLNIAANNFLKEVIKFSTVKYISFSLSDNYLSYTPSDISSEFIKSTNEPSEIELNFGYAPSFYKLYYSKNTGDILQSTFKSDFNLTKKEKDLLINYTKDIKTKISPSQVTKYFNIPFVYYLENILRLQVFNESISTLMGNFFHSLVETLMIIFYEKKVDRSKTGKIKNYHDDIDINNEIINYILNVDIANFNYNKYFNDFFNIYFKKMLEYTNLLKNVSYKDLSKKDIMYIKTMFYTKKQQDTIVAALEVVVKLEEKIPSKELIIEEKVELENFIGQSDLVKIYDNNTFSIIDYKSSAKEPFHKDKIIETINLLLKDTNEEVVLKNLDLLQLIFYAYFYSIKYEKLKMKDLAYFSYNSTKLNALSTTDLNLDYYTKGETRIINEEELKTLFLDVEKLLNKVLEEIKNFNFKIEIRKDLVDKKGRNESYYSIYEALAFFNSNQEEGENDEEN